MGISLENIAKNMHYIWRTSILEPEIPIDQLSADSQSTRKPIHRILYRTGTDLRCMEWDARLLLKMIFLRIVCVFSCVFPCFQSNPGDNFIVDESIYPLVMLQFAMV